jgi:hypothetical protein
MTTTADKIAVYVNLKQAVIFFLCSIYLKNKLIQVDRCKNMVLMYLYFLILVYLYVKVYTEPL